MFHTHRSFVRGLLAYGVFTVIASAVMVTLVLVYLPTSSAIPEPTEYTVQHTTVTQSLTTDTWGIFDPRTGTILKGENLDTSRPIASVSKLFTALCVMMSEKQYEPFTIRFSDIETEGRSGKLQAGSRMSPYELLFPLLIESSNDASVAIARFTGDACTTSVSTVSESLSLSHTRIAEPSGLSAKNTSTVRDLSVFFSYLYDAQPHLLDISRLPVYVASSTGYVNNNPAVHMDAFIGGKVGFTPEAGHTFLGAFGDSDRGREVGVVLLGSTDLEHDLQILSREGEKIVNASAILSP